MQGANLSSGDSQFTASVVLREYCEKLSVTLLIVKGIIQYGLRIADFYCVVRIVVYYA